MSVPSLRKRLILIILLPLIAISVMAGVWRYTVAQRTAEALYDRSLLAVALAISRDVAVSGGDALSAVTRDLMRNAAEGEVFYHVHGPDGVYVTGYATPPVPATQALRDPVSPLLFSAVYRGQDVRAVQLRETANLDGLEGISTVTVWQPLDNRERLAADLAGRAAIVIGILILTVAAVVWFGVERGLRPLTNLEAAISQRSSSDLRPIRRPLPKELSGLVATLNLLFDRVQRSIDSKEIFISNAAHQLRNPVAGVLSLAQSLQSAPDARDRDGRIADLVEAARHTSRLATQLLSYERAQASAPAETQTRFDLAAMTETVVDRIAPKVLRSDVELEFEGAPHPAWLRGDEVLFAEAIDNLIDNAVQHGGPQLCRIEVSVAVEGADAVITVRDDGKGIAPQHHLRAMSRFSQLSGGGGSGLGLPIAASVVRALGGAIALSDAAPGLRVTLRIPLEASREAEQAQQDLNATAERQARASEAPPAVSSHQAMAGSSLGRVDPP